MQFCNQEVPSDLRHPPPKNNTKKKKERTGSLKLSLIVVSLSTILSVYI